MVCFIKKKKTGESKLSSRVVRSEITRPFPVRSQLQYCAQLFAALWQRCRQIGGGPEGNSRKDKRFKESDLWGKHEELFFPPSPPKKEKILYTNGLQDSKVSYEEGNNGLFSRVVDRREKISSESVAEIRFYNRRTVFRRVAKRWNRLPRKTVNLSREGWV